MEEHQVEEYTAPAPVAPELTEDSLRDQSVHDSVEERTERGKAESNDDTDDNEPRGLEALGAALRDQDDLERNINRQADELLVAKANQNDRKRRERAEKEKSEVEAQIRKLSRRAENERGLGPATSRRIAAELSTYEARLKTLNDDISEIDTRIQERDEQLQKGDDQKGGAERLPFETQREFLIRTGKITPFSKAAGGPLARRNEDSLKDTLLVAEEGTPEPEVVVGDVPSEQFRSHRVLVKPGFRSSSGSPEPEQQSEGGSRKRRKLARGARLQTGREKEVEEGKVPSQSSDEFAEPEEEASDIKGSESDGFGDDDTASTGSKRRYSMVTVKMKREESPTVDDGNEALYQQRLQKWIGRRFQARLRAQGATAEESVDASISEWLQPHPTLPDKDLGDNLRVPGDIFPALFDYQKTGVQWLWELYQQRVGGILGDEMGLGKTIQVIAFIAALHYSNMLSQPVIVVVPATLIKQWVKEVQTWWPALRVSVLHSSGSGMSDNISRSAAKIVDRVVKDGHVLITTYSGLQQHARLVNPVQWGYAVLDEGHAIRNPNAALTIHCKELRTPHRIILSGTPIQNNLVELWSLFDFVFPMRLGNLVDFKNTFEIPIRLGGYANASNLQVQMANKCAEALKDAISPYLMQRNKLDVAADLPKKTERVLFCRLTRTQRDAYEAFLNSGDMVSIMDGNRQALYGIDILRKICNHPDLQDHRTLSVEPGYDYGNAHKSGKMLIVRELLNIWKRSGHKTLLFSQHKIMLDILEVFIRKMDGVNYRRMDGTTNIRGRQSLIDEFNNDPEIHVFLLTTKVGGLGVNLTGADRVIIFDPHWNPSTDMQARERAWRLGQKRNVEIYRLMIAGTIEEKIFHRQLFKQFLSNKVLKDPKQRQTFQMQDLHDLFTLGNPGEIESETGKLFKGTEKRFSPPPQDQKGAEKGAPIRPPERKGKEKAPSQDEAAEIRNLTGVASLQEQQVQEEAADKLAESTKTEQSGARNSSERIMSALFARSGVSAAFEHDHILNGSGKRVVRADPNMVEREAAKVAREATAALRKSEAAARDVEAGTVTWTGEYGTAGRPQQTARRAGPGSSTLLKNLQQRKDDTVKSAIASIMAQEKSRDASSREGTPAKEVKESDLSAPQKFARDIRNFLLAQGGSAHTQMLIDAFSYRTKTSRRNQEFKAVLAEMTDLGKGKGGRGTWTLKKEFR